MRNLPSGVRGFAWVVLFLLPAACASDAQITSQLDAGYAALEQKQYDQALSSADTVLSQTQGSGRGSAEALYLRGRAYEERSKSNMAASESDLELARKAYVEALGHSPAPDLEARIRTSIGSVAFFQEDYATAVQEYSYGAQHLDKADDKSWALYRVGLSQQRLSNWGAADATFAEVEAQYPNTIPADRAREHSGAKAFYVQVATFSNTTRASTAVTELRNQGMPALQVADPSGAARHYVRVGPLTNYMQARRLKARLASTYSDALIVP